MTSADSTTCPLPTCEDHCPKADDVMRLRRQRDLALARENAACQTAGTHAEREGAVAADLAALRVLARELSGFARFHATHSEVSTADRARVTELCDLIEGDAA